MAFLQHIPCPKCGSRDNLAEYTENYYCFGCGYTKKNNDLNDQIGLLGTTIDSLSADNTRLAKENICFKREGE